MDNLISKQSFWKSQYNLILNDDFEQIFSDLRSFLLEVDNAMDEIKWPILKREIIKELADFEVLATKTKANQIQGWEKDENDVDHFKRQRDQLFAMSKIDFTQAEKLKDNIRDAALQAIIRVQGKQLFIDMIKSFNRDFNSIDWKDSTIARQEVNRGMDLANSGADEDKLRSQLSTIINQMKSPDLAGIPKL
jgi:molecular chaperone DnaK